MPHARGPGDRQRARPGPGLSQIRPESARVGRSDPPALRDRGRRPSRVFGYSMLQGFVFFVVSLYWAVIPLHSFADAPLWVAIGPMLLLAAVEALFVAASVAAASMVTRRLRLSLVLTLPVAWTAFEWLRSWFPIGFPLESAGLCRLPQPGADSVCRNHRRLRRLGSDRLFQRGHLHRADGAAVGQPAQNPQPLRADRFNDHRDRFQRHQWPGSEPSHDGALKIAMVQGDIPQSIKWDPNFRGSSFKVYVDQTLRAAKDHPDLIVWPEAAAAFYFQPTDEYPLAASQRQRVSRGDTGAGARGEHADSVRSPRPSVSETARSIRSTAPTWSPPTAKSSTFTTRWNWRHLPNMCRRASSSGSS